MQPPCGAETFSPQVHFRPVFIGESPGKQIRTSRSPTPCRAGRRRSRTFDNDACRRGSSGRWNGNGGRCPRASSGSTANRRLAGHRPASGAAPEGLCELVVAAVGAPGRRVGDRRVGQPRNHPADAKKNGMTQRKSRVLGDPAAGRCRVRGAHGTGPGHGIAQPYDPDCPVVCMDEQPVQLVKETRPPVAATKPRGRGGSTTSTSGLARPRSSCSVLHPAAPDPRIHETGYRVGAWRWPRGRFSLWCQEPVVQLDPESREHPVLRGRHLPVSAPCRFRTGGLHASAFAVRR